MGADPPAAWTTPANVRRWGAWAVAVAVAVPTFYALTRWAWALGIPLGFSRQALRAEAAQSPGIWLAGAGLATLAVGGALLTLGLTQRWGEVYPRWVPFLRGKPVRPRTAIIPATVVAILVTSAGMAYLRAMLTGQVSLDWDPAPPSCGRCGELPWAPPRSPTTCAAAATAATAIDHELNPLCRLLAAISSLGWGGVVLDEWST